MLLTILLFSSLSIDFDNSAFPSKFHLGFCQSYCLASHLHNSAFWRNGFWQFSVLNNFSFDNFDNSVLNNFSARSWTDRSHRRLREKHHQAAEGNHPLPNHSERIRLSLQCNVQMATFEFWDITWDLIWCLRSNITFSFARHCIGDPHDNITEIAKASLQK